MFRPQLFLAALLCGLLAVGQASAANVWLSLNLEFNDPTDFGSGGTWTVVSKADERGLAGAALQFNNNSLNFNPATGFVLIPGFEFQFSGIFGGLILEVFQGDDPASKTLDVGVIGGPFPSTYVDDPNLVVFGANPDLGSFTGGVGIATGTFDSGDIPAWVATVAEPISANVWASGPSNPAILANVFTTVRYVTAIPEPASLLLLGVGVLSLTAIRRRR